MAAKAKDQEFLEVVVKALVSHPEDVSVTRSIDEMGVLLTLKINPADMGQVIGRRGETARAIRNLLRIVGRKNNARVNLKIEEPAGSTQRAKASTSTSTEDLKL
ncbi:MAG: KH domain-containing protein [Patescibacteria group bacterium]|nr:KH domain-containing protein [Patescibacteria group bacterium]